MPEIKESNMRNALEQKSLCVTPDAQKTFMKIDPKIIPIKGDQIISSSSSHIMQRDGSRVNESS